MPDFKRKPRNAVWLTPYLTLSNVDKTLKAYTEAFGFAVDIKDEENGLPRHLEITHGGKPIAMGAAEEFEGSDCGVSKSTATLGVDAPQTFSVYVESVDAHLDGLRKTLSPSSKTHAITPVPFGLGEACRTVRRVGQGFGGSVGGG